MAFVSVRDSWVVISLPTFLSSRFRAFNTLGSEGGCKHLFASISVCITSMISCCRKMSPPPLKVFESHTNAVEQNSSLLSAKALYSAWRCTSSSAMPKPVFSSVRNMSSPSFLYSNFLKKKSMVVSFLCLFGLCTISSSEAGVASVPRILPCCQAHDFFACFFARACFCSVAWSASSFRNRKPHFPSSSPKAKTRSSGLHAAQVTGADCFQV
mmetsp:Transcript_1994/g.3324  ORF Transcript_1994/g.3324 Transcript_1994/m.3324 type:complete len:212 (+) Transcript_1994:78-713(+)